MNAKRWRRALRLLLSALAVGAALASCTSRHAGPRLTVGTVDTARVLHTHPRYEEEARQYLKERVASLQQAFRDLPPGAVKLDRESGLARLEPQARERILQAERDVNRRWMERTQEFLQAGHAAIRRAAEEICREKGIDMVLVDSRFYPTVEYGAVDITDDILSRLSRSKGEPAEEASP